MRGWALGGRHHRRQRPAASDRHAVQRTTRLVQLLHLGNATATSHERRRTWLADFRPTCCDRPRWSHQGHRTTWVEPRAVIPIPGLDPPGSPAVRPDSRRTRNNGWPRAWASTGGGHIRPWIQSAFSANAQGGCGGLPFGAVIVQSGRHIPPVGSRTSHVRPTCGRPRRASFVHHHLDL